MIILLNLGILAVFLFTGSLSLVLWGWAIGKLYRGEPIIAPEPRLKPQVGAGELLIGFGVLVLVSALLAPLIVPKGKLEISEASEAVVQSSEGDQTKPVESLPEELPDSLPETVDDEAADVEPVQEQDPEQEQEHSDEQSVDGEGIAAGDAEKVVKQDPKMDLDMLIATIVLNSIATVVAILAVLLWMKLQGLSFEQAGFLPTTKHVMIGFAGALMVLPPVMLLQGLLASQIRYEHPLLEVLQENVSWRVMLAMAISASFIAPVVEEIYFRGLLQGFLEKLSVIQQESPEMPLRRPLWPAFLSSLLFALAHSGQGPAPISLFFLALAIGYLYRQTGSIWPGLIIHFVLNATSTGTMILVTLIGAPPE